MGTSLSAEGPTTPSRAQEPGSYVCLLSNLRGFLPISLNDFALFVPSLSQKSNHLVDQRISTSFERYKSIMESPRTYLPASPIGWTRYEHVLNNFGRRWKFAGACPLQLIIRYPRSCYSQFFVPVSGRTPHGTATLRIPRQDLPYTWLQTR